MQILLGTLGLLQCAVLPGLIVRKKLVRVGIVEEVLRVFLLSLLSNYLCVFLLAALGLYNRTVVLILIAVEIFLFFWLCRKALVNPIGKSLASVGVEFRNELRPLADFLSGEKSGLRGWIWLASGCFALSGVIWGLHLCRLNFGTVFSGWDTLFSWNQYALIWSGGSVPNIGGMYPQLLSLNWSISYLLQGENAVQFFNTLLPPLFFLMIQLMLFDLGFQRQESGFFFAAIIARYMMKKLMGDQLFDGYMDVPCAAISLMSMYTLLKAEKRSLAKQRQAIFLGMVFAAEAAVTKQSGFAIFLVAPIAFHFLLRDAVKSLSRKQKIAIAGAAALIVIPWYLHCFLFNTHGYERELIADGIMAYNQRFGLHYRMHLAFETLGKYGVCFLLCLVGLPFVPKQYRLIFSLMVWPLTLIWAGFYSYDARNLGPALPFVSLLCGMAIAGFGSFLLRIFEKSKVEKIPLAALCFVIAAFSAFLLVRRYPNEKLITDQKAAQKTLFGERLNAELLYGIFGETHSGNDIYTDYPARFLPGYEECCSAAEWTDTFQVQQVLEQEKINWMLLPVIMPNDTDPSKELIEQCITDGKCEQVRCSDGYYKSYCLYRINR